MGEVLTGRPRHAHGGWELAACHCRSRLTQTAAFDKLRLRYARR